MISKIAQIPNDLSDNFYGLNMTIRKEIITQIQTFLNLETKQKKDYRQFTGNLDRLTKTPRLEDLSLTELSTCQKIQEFLKEWTNNPSEHPKIFTREKELEQLSEKFNKWLEQSQQKLTRTNSNTTNINWETRFDRGQKILSWVEWFEKHQQTIKFGLFVFGLLFAWLIIEKVVEKIR